MDGKSLKYQKPKSEDVAKCEYCGELCRGYAHIVAGRAFCKLPSTCSEEWTWQYKEFLKHINTEEVHFDGTNIL